MGETPPGGGGPDVAIGSGLKRKSLHQQFTADKWAEKLKGVPNRVAEQWVAALRGGKNLGLSGFKAHPAKLLQDQARPIVQAAKSITNIVPKRNDRLIELKNV